MRLIIAGADSGVLTTVVGFNPSIAHGLSYQVNTAGIGTISNIVLDSTNVTLTAPPNTFTIARTAYAGFYNSSGPPAELSNYDNFFVATVPEPSNFDAISAVVLVSIFDICARRSSAPSIRKGRFSMRRPG